MVVNIRYCKVTGIKHPRIRLQGWLSDDVDKAVLISCDLKVWEQEYTNTKTKVNMFDVDLDIPECFSVSFIAYSGDKEKKIDIFTNIVVRFVNKWKESQNKQRRISAPLNAPKRRPDIVTFNPFIGKEYQEWNSKKKIVIDEKMELIYQPLISILIPVYNVEGKYLSECIESILNQTYQNFEICLADDCSNNQDTLDVLKYYENKDSRIKVCYRKENGHISLATNSALEMAKGEFVGLVDNDDIIAENALEEIVKVLNRDPSMDFIYTDEDKLELNGDRVEPHFKPDFARDNFLILNYICHFSVIRKKIIDEIGGFRKGYEGAQDYDLFLRVINRTEKIYHIPKILYQWRKIPGSTAVAVDSKSYAVKAGVKVLESYLKEAGINAKVEIQKETGNCYRVSYPLESEPMILIVVFYNENTEGIQSMIDMWITQMHYKNYQFAIVMDNMKEKRNLPEYKGIVDVHWIEGVENLNQFVVSSECEQVLFWNSSNIIADKTWLKVVVSYANNLKIGAVGSKVIEEKTKEFMEGYVITKRNKIIPVRNMYIGMGYAPVNRCIVGKTAYLVNKQHFIKVGGLDKKLDGVLCHFDLQMKLQNYLRRNIVVGQVEYIQKEEIGWEEFLPHRKEFERDPWYNPNFSDMIAYQLEIK